MLAVDRLDRALLVSPILDMEGLILTMMGWAGVTEEKLRERGEIAASFGQTLSWEYLCWVREHPVHSWNCPVRILYGSEDNMTPRRTVEEYVRRHGARLTVLEAGALVPHAGTAVRAAGVGGERSLNREECLICKAPLEYLLQDEEMECAVCHRREASKTRCVNGHYVLQ